MLVADIDIVKEILETCFGGWNRSYRTGGGWRSGTANFVTGYTLLCNIAAFFEDSKTESFLRSNV